MSQFKLRIFHFRLVEILYTTDYIKETLSFIRETGFNSVFFEFETKFPYSSIPELEKDSPFSQSELKDIFSYATKLGLKIIVKGLSFSHAGDLFKYESCKQYAEAACNHMNLLLPEALKLIIRQAEDILELCPEIELIHLGGDEIFNLGKSPQVNDFIMKHGKSKLYIDFVNPIVEYFAKKGKQIGIWSDMLIRYPQNISELDKRTILFYWDYWSYGERVPFMTIGGGCSDTFILNRQQLRGDLEKMYRWTLIREKDEIPLGHIEGFAKYYQFDESRESAKAFPYLQFFKDNGLKTICALLPYTEKGSIFPNMQEKFEHIKGFLKEGKETESVAYLSCLWQPHWPLIPLMRIALSSIKYYDENPELTESELFSKLSSETKIPAELLKQLYSCSVNFEFADTLNIFWASMPFDKRLQWIKDAGIADDEKKRCQHVITACSDIINSKAFPSLEKLLRLTISELHLRARIEVNFLNESATTEIRNELLNQAENLLRQLSEEYRKILLPPGVDAYVSPRWESLLKLLK